MLTGAPCGDLAVSSSWLVPAKALALVPAQVSALARAPALALAPAPAPAPALAPARAATRCPARRSGGAGAVFLHPPPPAGSSSYCRLSSPPCRSSPPTSGTPSHRLGYAEYINISSLCFWVRRPCFNQLQQIVRFCRRLVEGFHYNQ